MVRMIKQCLIIKSDCYAYVHSLGFGSHGDMISSTHIGKKGTRIHKPPFVSLLAVSLLVPACSGP